ncbi:MAG: TonB-dependent receptor [Chitinophagaceae bacterium]|nr:TonB-dependent receptor [Chitinophagaceae bacterium]
MKKVIFSIIILFAFLFTKAQERSTDSTAKELGEVVISANKFPEKKRNIAQRVDVIGAKLIATVNAQNTGDLLINTGNVFVQKSQQGGSSPVIRGFEASRVLLVVDGVRMNNLVYRSGHLQNAITVDQNMLQSMEVLYGPSSTLYGSDALGGVVHFRTKAPVLAKDNKNFVINGTSFARYSSANNEQSIHADVNLGWKKFAWLQSYTFSDFGDMKMGSNYPDKYPKFGKRDSFITRINGIDTVLKNDDSRVQKFSGYRQWDILQKFLFKQSDKVSHTLNFQYSNTTDVPRYDRLQDKRNFGGSIGNTLRYAEWYYGPQKRLFTAYDLSIVKAGWFDNVNININYQDIEESRVQREYRRYDRLDSRVEKIKVGGFVMDTRKIMGQHELTMGIDGQFNKLNSTATRTNINTGAVSNLDTRYPNGMNTMNNLGLFAQHIYKFKNGKLVLNDGLRLQSSTLSSNIADNSFFNLPYTSIEQKNTAVTGNIGLVYLPTSQTKLSTNLSSGFRVPNVDDLAKIFESGTSGNIRQLIVPNPDIKPERTYNIDLGISQNFGKNVRTEASAFYTWFRDALVKAPFQLNGQDSVTYNGVRSQVLANVNANKAYLYGFNVAVYATFVQYVTFSSTINFTRGRFKTNAAKISNVYEKQANGTYALVSRNVSSKPLDHIPPVFGKTSVVYEKNKVMAEVFALYNGWKKLDQFNADGEDNAQYATADGMPSWFTLNFRSSYKVQKNISVQLSVENILDRNYRYFASGFSAPGRNFIIAVRAGF